MAVPEDNVSVLVVVSTVNIEALSTVVSNVSVSSSIVGDLLVNLTDPWSDDGSNTNSITVTLLVGNGKVSSISSSDGSSSSVEDEQLLALTWGVGSDSESVLVCTNMLVPEESSCAGHFRSDRESNVVTEWLFWIAHTLLINEPGLVETVMAVPVDDVSIVFVLTTMDIKALLTVVSDVSSCTIEPEESDVLVVLVRSDSSSNTNSVCLSSLVSKSVVSFSSSSNSLGSGIEDEPLLVVFRVVISDSKSVLMSTNMLVPEESSVTCHS
jgi:hypothetical protein